MLGRLLCVLGFHRWRIVATTPAIVALVCQRCYQRVYSSHDGQTRWREEPPWPR